MQSLKKKSRKILRRSIDCFIEDLGAFVNRICQIFYRTIYYYILEEIVVKKVWVSVFAVLFVLLAVVIFLGEKLGLSEQALKIIQGGLWIGSLIAVIASKTEEGRTDGDLIAGAEDEDGLVFALKTPVEELVQKDRVTFNVLKERRS